MLYFFIPMESKTPVSCILSFPQSVRISERTITPVSYTHLIRGTTLTLSGLSLTGSILFPIKKDEEQVLRVKRCV